MGFLKKWNHAIFTSNNSNTHFNEISLAVKWKKKKNIWLSPQCILDCFSMKKFFKRHKIKDYNMHFGETTKCEVWGKCLLILGYETFFNLTYIPGPSQVQVTLSYKTKSILFQIMIIKDILQNWNNKNDYSSLLLKN